MSLGVAAAITVPERSLDRLGNLAAEPAASGSFAGPRGQALKMDYAVARQHMVDSQVRTNKVTDERLIEAIRVDRPDLPIILATGYAELPPGMGVGVPRLTKPYFQNDLARALTAVTR